MLVDLEFFSFEGRVHEVFLSLTLQLCLFELCFGLVFRGFALDLLGFDLKFCLLKLEGRVLRLLCSLLLCSLLLMCLSKLLPCVCYEACQLNFDVFW